MFRKGFKRFVLCMITFMALFFMQFSGMIGLMKVNTSIEAKAASYEIYVNQYGLMTLRGSIYNADDYGSFCTDLYKRKDKDKVTAIKADFDFVLPENCSLMFYTICCGMGYSAVETIDLSLADYSKVTSVAGMFVGCPAKEIHFNVPSTVNNITSMFDGCDNMTYLDVSKWNTSNVEFMDDLFYGCGALRSISGISDLDTSNVVNMSEMFGVCNNIKELNLSSWDTSNVENMDRMFYGCSALKKITVLDKWSTKSVTTSDDMFFDCISLVGGNGTKYDLSRTDATYARIDNRGKPGYLTGPMSDTRSVISEIEATSKDLSDIPVYGKEILQFLEFTVNKGKPAYFFTSFGYGEWLKLNENSGKWEQVTKSTFEGGKYRFKCMVRVDGEDADNYVLADKGLSVKVNGVSWETDTVVDEGDSYVLVTSPEFVVEAPDEPDDPTEPEKPVEGNKVEDTKAPAVANEASHKVGDVVTGGGATYEITSVDEGKLSVSYKKNESAKASSVTIPAIVTVDNKEYKVTAIANNAFANNKKLKKITIGSNIEKIGKKAFFKCKNLKSVTIKTTLLTKSSVGGSAFKGIHANAKVKVSKKVLKSYQKVLKSRGINGKTQKIK